MVGTAGDRTDDAIYAMGAMAATTADRVVVAGRIKYLRGREPGEMEDIWRAGAAQAGVVDAEETPNELSALVLLLDAQLTSGSAIAVCALEQRQEMADEVIGRGGREMTSAQVAERVAAGG